ncbi:MAG: ferredoxin [Bacilli bacterium]|nr:ferredoxin [Bacilli bacterium]MDD4607737.1 ferredoxin [Bacilli bacterium]
MKSVKIIEDACIGCGACEAIVDDVFKLNDDGISTVIIDEVPEELEEDVRDAAESCPTEAIAIEEDN